MTCSYQEYVDHWFDDQELTSDERQEIEELDQFFSADLTEATYRIPFQVLDENVQVMDKVMKDYPPWRVFRSLFVDFEREVDMAHLIEKGYWPENQPTITTKRGSFMGDSMSFIHLTLFLGGVLSAACIKFKTKRPLGQSVGDDLLLLKVKTKLALYFCWLAEQLGGKFSKINSISRDSFTFCENYGGHFSGTEQLNHSWKEYQFGDLFFLDTFKGSIFSGKSKVKAKGMDPFLGHATLLGKQATWHPVGATGRKASTFLWARNYVSACKMSSGMASLPVSLGGLEICVGKIIRYNDVSFQEGKLPWYESIYTLGDKEFYRYYLLLRGIYTANPKGYAWSNSWQTVTELCKDLQVISCDDVHKLIPPERKGMTTREALSYVEKTLEYVSFHSLADLLARQESFLLQWEGKRLSTYANLKSRDSKKRANHVWGIIKANVPPLPQAKWKSNSMSQLNTMFKSRTWGLWVPKDQPAIRRIFGYMPRLYMDLYRTY